MTSTSSPSSCHEAIQQGKQLIQDTSRLAKEQDASVEIKYDYILAFDKHTFEEIDGELRDGQEAVVAGAMWLGRTRLIDNVLVHWQV